MGLLFAAWAIIMACGAACKQTAEYACGRHSCNLGVCEHSVPASGGCMPVAGFGQQTVLTALQLSNRHSLLRANLGCRSCLVQGVGVWKIHAVQGRL